LHKSVELLLVVVLDTFHTSSGCSILDAGLLLLAVLMLDWAITRRMRFAVAEVTQDGCTVDQELLGAVLELVTLLAA